MAVTEELPRWEKWTGRGDEEALSPLLMHKRTAEDLDQHDRDFAALRADIHRLTSYLAAAALSLVAATVTLWLTYLGGPH